MRRTTASRTILLVFTAALLMVGLQVQAQNPTGTLTGRVTDQDGGALPGVTVTATSPNLQGSRVTVTGANGDYKLPAMPPGNYSVSYQLEGFSTSQREVKLSAAQTSISDISMQLGEVSEEIVVTGRLSTISETTTGASTYTFDEVEKLPVERDPTQVTLLAPGVHDTGPGSRSATNDRSGNVTISGAMSFENLWLVNGVVINENVRGQSLPLFVEDAIQETTVSSSGVSAEYGRFTGGVVNAITKAGGNTFSGSFRTNFNNDDWVSENELSPERDDELNETFEATLGGYLWKDHVWFFLTGRELERSASDSTRAITTLTFPTTDIEERFEAKVTLTPHPSHSIVGSYLDLDRTQTNVGFQEFIDLDSLNKERQDPQEIKAINYTGILSSNFFVEGQYSERDFTIGIGSGGPRDLIFGTVMRRRGTANRYFSPTFCGECDDEIRNNENLLVKGSYFLSTEGAGSHDLVFGYDTFEDIRFVVNHQTGSDFTVYGSDILVDAQQNIYPVFDGTRTWIRFFAVFNEDLAQPTSFKTNSFYVNDSWQLNDKWSFNVGVRYDENDGTNSAGAPVTSDSKISPRLAANYDLKGDGDTLLRASYGTYVAGIANNRANSTSNGGAIGSFIWAYGGPLVNTDADCVNRGDCTTTPDALRILYDWYLSQGGSTSSVFDIDPNAPINAFNIQASIPGETSVIRGDIKSPSADEITLGISKRIGVNGAFRADLVRREWEDFYSNRTTLDTGTVDTPAGVQDLTLVGNFGNNVLERTYTGLHTQFRYRLTDKFTLSANYTLSQLEGNVNGETPNGGPSTTSPNNYPEYQDPRWAFPVGDLAGDQRHRVRLWGVYDIFNNARNALSVSLLQRFDSGQPYGAAGGVDTRDAVGDIGYQQVPTSFTYWFTDRDAFHTDDITRTDLSLNYSFYQGAFGKDLEIFVQPEILNIFDEDGAIDVDATVQDATTSGNFAEFDPFTQTPVEGVHWAKGENFGQPQNEFDFQTPRTFRLSVGIRFR